MTEIRQRTELNIETWRFCYVCRKPTLSAELVSQRRVTRENEGPYYNTQSYSIVDVCVTCYDWDMAEYRKNLDERFVAILSILCLFSTWPYLGLAGLIGVVVKKVYRHHGWRVKRKVKQLRLTWRKDA